MDVSIDDILSAQKRIATGMIVSPCPQSLALSESTGCSIYCKLDHLQRTGSFKERGARNALLLLGDEQRRRGVIAASAGNHALGLAYHGKLLGIPVTVVMPKFAPLIKSTTCRHLGAEVIFHGGTFAQAVAHARQIAAEQGLGYIHGFDDAAIIAGQGTVGLEIIEQVPNCDAVVVPVGGGGLIAGVSLAVKSLRKNVQVIGVEAENTASFTAALAAGAPVTIECKPTLADGLAVGRVGERAFNVARQYVDRVVTVSEDQLALAILRMAEREKSVVEGAAAAPLAACLAGKLPELAGRTVVLLVTGGNIDPTILSRVIDKGLVADGRICRFTASISDRPGGLADLAGLIASAGASIKDITHDRAFSGPDVSAVNVVCTVETSGVEHMQQLYALLRSHRLVVHPIEGS